MNLLERLPVIGGAALRRVAPGVDRIGVLFVNVYTIDAGDGRWFLVDTGLPGTAQRTRSICDAHFGRSPEAILLTHAHFDHAGGAAALAEHWDVPIFVHERERPYVNGQSDYPPQDPTPGGAICFLSRFFPRGGRDLGERVRTLPGDGSIPGLSGWRWVFTPGHTAGHVAFFRESDRTLVAGDVLATVDLDSWVSQVWRTRELSRSPTPFTPDWPAIRASLHRLTGLGPTTIAAGHGLPMTGEAMYRALVAFADRPQAPRVGRYAGASAVYDDSGAVESVPPPVADPLPLKLAVVGIVALLGAAAFAGLRVKHRR